MSEPKWWPMGEIPTEDGNYLCRFDGRVSCWVFPKDRPLKFELGQFYGPIPKPPKEPPKLRRFTATHMGEMVSGVTSDTYYCDRKFQVYRNCKDGKCYYIGIFREDELSDIKFIDKE